MQNFRSRSVKVDHFAMIPRADIPRSKFKIEHAHKTTFDAGYLVPIYVDEILPGDTFSLQMHAFARMATPIYPVMDNLYLETFFFFVPNRILWDNWQRFMGEQISPGASTSFVVPTLDYSEGFPPLSVFDYFGLPTQGQGTPGTFYTINSLPFRAYNKIFNQWFRDQNLTDALPEPFGDSDNVAYYSLQRRGKRHDYFTSCLPFVQKGVAPTLGLGGILPVQTNGQTPSFTAPTSATPTQQRSLLGGRPTADTLGVSSSGDPLAAGANIPLIFGANTGLQVNLADAAAVTVNQLRLSFQVQKLLERDARGGTRYTEILRSHFGVISPDARLQRPEYLGGGSTPINITPIAQTAGTATAGNSTPLGTLSAFGTASVHGHGFTQSFTEHGYVIGLASVRADLTYQQGIRKMWNRSTRYDFYFPVFANLGEQAVLNKEIYWSNNDALDDAVFGYQERWAEYRYHPSRLSGLFRSTTPGTLDGWHLAQRFNSLPTLNNTFIQENPPMDRVLAVGSAANGQQFIFDSIFSVEATRAMPMYSVPGLVDHF